MQRTIVYCEYYQSVSDLRKQHIKKDGSNDGSHFVCQPGPFLKTFMSKTFDFNYQTILIAFMSKIQCQSIPKVLKILFIYTSLFVYLFVSVLYKTKIHEG